MEKSKFFILPIFLNGTMCFVTGSGEISFYLAHAKKIASVPEC